MGTTTASGPEMLAIRLVAVEKIVVEDRFRRLDESKAEEIAQSIQESGRLLQEIGVTQDLHLVWGAHRLRAFIKLGWREIPAQILPYDSKSAQAKIDELDENLQRCELNHLEQARALSTRKHFYELLHPEARRGAKGGRKPKSKSQKQSSDEKLTAKMAVSSEEANEPPDVDSFVADAARRTGKSERTIRRATAIGGKILPEVAEAVAAVPTVAKNAKELGKLAKLDPELQRSVAGCLTSGECRTVTEALAESDTPTAEPVEEACEVLKRLLDDAARRWWKKCGKSATAQLAAGVLESVAEQWVTQDWRKSGGPITRRAP